MQSAHALPYFLLASLSIHAGLLLPSRFDFDLAAPAASVLSINLESAHERTATAIKPTIAPRQSTPREAKLETPIAQAGTMSAHSDQREVQATEALPNQTAPQPESSAQLRIQARVLADLQRYFEYPATARRRGWQGTVWLAFTVDADGVPKTIHVAQSSGYDVLDRSAIKAMQRVEALPEARYWLNGQTLDMRLPVIYRLVE